MQLFDSKVSGRIQFRNRIQHGWVIRSFLSVLLLSASLAASSQDRPGDLLASDDFRHGASAWLVEQQAPDSQVQARDGVLDIVAPAGLTLWYRQPFAGSYEIQFAAMPVKDSFPGHPDRVSDLNLFWNATVGGRDPTQRQADGSLKAYDDLQLYYLGFGANGNQTTRLRRYDGTSARPQLAGYAQAGAATDDDRLGPPPEFARLKDGHRVRLRVQSVMTANGATLLRVLADEQLVFESIDPTPYLQ